ncbi:hypothetical protein [Clostridium oceanicum]|uniref:Uncharacterized protein n=1 Tax=Clostridium oceanicum TaxID=1543 RepID=A0ABN1JXM0_9CLOT
MRCSLNPRIIKIINKMDKKEFGLKYGVLRLGGFSWIISSLIVFFFERPQEPIKAIILGRIISLIGCVLIGYIGSVCIWGVYKEGK